MRKPKAPRLVTVAILTTVTVIFWVFLGVYEILTSKTPVAVPPELLTKIDPQLDIETLESIPQRMYFLEEDVNFNAGTIPTLLQVSSPEVPQTDTEPVVTEQGEIDEQEF
jgi:hypothetical protein